MGRKTGFYTLEDQVISSDLCTRCGGCVASCPVDALKYGPDRIELVGECISCGTCLRICPGKGMDFSYHENRLMGRSRDRPIGTLRGVYRKKMNLVASDKEILRAGYFGGRVSALLINALDTGEIDAALLTDWSSSGSLTTGEARIARSREDVLSLASSKYIFSPVLTLLKEVTADDAIRSLAVVGLPCHIEAMRNMEIDPEASKVMGKVEYMIGLNCGAPHIDRSSWESFIWDHFDVSPEDIKSFRAYKVSKDIIEMKVRSSDGRSRDKRIPITRFLHHFSKDRNWPRCALCPDYSSDLSDVCFGFPLIRTAKGEHLVDSAVSRGYLKKGTITRYVAQYFTDMVAGRAKIWRTRRRIKRRSSGSDPFPEYK